MLSGSKHSAGSTSRHLTVRASTRVSGAEVFDFAAEAVLVAKPYLAGAVAAIVVVRASAGRLA
jgi:hypothetical protein